MGSRENFELVKQWLNRCLTEHEKCANSVQASPPLPTRVIDVGAGGDGSIIRLVSSAGRHGPYIALSHVWGRVRILTTTVATFDERLNEITMESLPRTFQNLVEIARQLSIRYVWVDSLCIYSHRTTMKHLGTMRFVPQFFEGFDFMYLASQIWQYILPYFRLKSIGTPCQFFDLV